jgi:AraC-like DNA-binding protein
MWSYWRDDFAEYGSWSGEVSPTSGVHFHTEHQLTFVISGCRYFKLGGENICVTAGSCLFIPAGYPHGSLPISHKGTRCLNVYSRTAEFGPHPLVLTFLPGQQHLAATVGACFALEAADLPWRTESGGAEPQIADLSARVGLSREAFTRSFSRQVGIPPHAYRIVSRLNDARQRLRDGDRLADIAIDCGFFDQTHFARHFYRLFGATPGAYRKSIR